MGETAVWYWNHKGKAQGPFTFDQVKTMVAKGELKGHDLVFKENASEWKRASEWNELDPLFDDDKSTFTKLIKLPEEERTIIRSDNKPVEEKWVLLIRIEEDREIRFKQKGPYGTDEIKRYLREGKVSHSDHIWKKGAPKWMPISDVPDFHANQLNVTEEVKELLVDAIQMPSTPEAMPIPKPQPAPHVVEKPVAVQQFVVQPASPHATIPIPQKQKPVEMKMKTEERPVMIPVIPHIVPVGGSHGRVESFGRMEAEVVGPSDDEILAAPAARVVLEDDTELTEAPAMQVMAPVGSDEDYIEDEGYAKHAEEEAAFEEPHIPEVLPSNVSRIPLKVEPRAEPRRPEVSKAIADDGARTRGWLGKLSPALSFLLLVFMGVGIWATLKTRSPILNGDRPVPVQDTAKQPDPAPTTTTTQASTSNVEVKLGGGVDIEADDEIFDREIAEASDEEVKPAIKPVAKSKKPAPVKKEKEREVAVKEIKEVKEPKESRELSDLPTINSEPKSTQLKVNNKAGYFEMIGAFRKGELLEVRIDGNSGSILDLPALHQRLEVRSTKNFVHRVSLADLRIPKGTYQFSLKFGPSKSAKKLTWGGEKAQFESALVQHRKQIAFDQQQERKKILKALKDFNSVLTRAEVEAGKGNLKVVQKDLSEKMPAEVKIVKLSRHELVYNEAWEKLATQWDRLQSMAKDGGRGPASVSEITKAKKAMSTLESEIKNQSVADLKD